MELTHARIELAADSSPRCRQARAMLAEEVARRAQRVWPAADAGGGVITLRAAGTAVRGGARWSDQEARSFRAAEFAARPVGFCVERAGDALTVTGNDARGVLYGVGWLLRHLEVRRNAVVLPDVLLAKGPVCTAPHYPLRGHQIGYRPKTNSYVGWTVAEWEQYIRELAMFGANAVEVIPPVSDDEPDSDHFPLPQIDMLREVSAIADRYDVDLWIWFPALESDYTDAATARQRARRLAARCSRRCRGSTPCSYPAAIRDRHRRTCCWPWRNGTRRRCARCTRARRCGSPHRGFTAPTKSTSTSPSTAGSTGWTG